MKGIYNWFRRIFKKKNKPIRPPNEIDSIPTWESEDYFFNETFQYVLNFWAKKLARTIPRDIDKFCPKYSLRIHEEKVEFWKFLLMTVSYFESGFNSSVKYTENFSDRNGKRVISRGLFQLSIESIKGYSRHGLTAPNFADELHEPPKNLDCAAFVFHHWIERDLVISEITRGQWRGGARYWAVLRNPKVNQIKKICLKKFS